MFLRNVGYFQRTTRRTYQKIELFIATAVRTSNPTKQSMFKHHKTKPEPYECVQTINFLKWSCIMNENIARSSIEIALSKKRNFSDCSNLKPRILLSSAMCTTSSLLRQLNVSEKHAASTFRVLVTI
jgi:hypothetical protein